MKDFVRENWKSAAAGAAGSFLLSLLVGLVTRNPPGVAFLRALLLAALFAGLAAGLTYLARRHLLEAARDGGPAHPGENATRSGRGDRVDIVLPEESPLGRAGYGSSGEARPFDAGDEIPSLLSEGLGEPGAEESEGLGELAEELGEELPKTAEYVGEQSDEARQAIAEEESGERWSESTHGRGKAAAADAIGPGTADDRDGLPDISNLEIATESNVDERAERKGPGGKRPEDVLRGAVSGQDPLTIARAIRTVLKRDDKG